MKEREREGRWEMTDGRRRYQSNLSLLTSCCCQGSVVVVGGVGGVVVSPVCCLVHRLHLKVFKTPADIFISG